MRKTKPNLNKITTMFGKAYRTQKRSAERQAELQKKLFEAFNLHLEDQIRSQKVIEYEDYPELSLEEIVSVYHPGWRLKRVVDDKSAVIEEDPALMKFSFVNHEDGTVYGRTITQGNSSLDEERLRSENPELWERVTEWPETIYSLLSNFLLNFLNVREGDDTNDVYISVEIVHAFLNEYLNTTDIRRILRNPDEWSDPDLQQMQKYLVPGKISTRLLAPRKANEEELA